MGDEAMSEDYGDQLEVMLERIENGEMYPCPEPEDCEHQWHCMVCDMHDSTTDPETWLCHACCTDKPCESPCHHLGV